MSELWKKVKWGWVVVSLILIESGFLVGAYVGKVCGDSSNITCQIIDLHASALKDYQSLIAGLMAIAAALIGAIALHSSWSSQLKMNRLSAINLCRANGAIIRDHVSKGKFRLPTTETVNRFLLSAEGLAIVDPQLTWLAVGTASLPLRIVSSQNVEHSDSDHVYAQCCALVDLLEQIYKQVSDDTFIPILPTSSILAAVVKKVRTAGYSDRELGVFANLLASTSPAADAEPQPK